MRTQKVDSGGTKNYVCDGSSPASAVLKDGAAVYTPGLSERRGSTSKFLHSDALGSTRGITDSSQSVTDSMLYDAFGNVLSRTGTTPTPFGFVGSKQYQSDSDSGLQLLGHRYYDPSIGRFLSQDPIRDGTNWYAYCDNNPLGNTDPTGLSHNNGKGKNKSKNLQWALVGISDNTKWKPRPWHKGDPVAPGRPTPPKVIEGPGGGRYPAWPASPKDGSLDKPHYIVPVLPGDSIGGGGLDMDAGWDPVQKIWKKNPDIPFSQGTWHDPETHTSIPPSVGLDQPYEAVSWSDGFTPADGGLLEDGWYNHYPSPTRLIYPNCAPE